MFCKSKDKRIMGNYTLNVTSKENKGSPKFEGAESGKLFTCEEQLFEQVSSEPFLGETVREQSCGKLSKKPGGTRFLDKSKSGEYVLGRPPKSLEVLCGLFY